MTIERPEIGRTRAVVVKSPRWRRPSALWGRVRSVGAAGESAAAIHLYYFVQQRYCQSAIAYVERNGGYFLISGLQCSLAVRGCSSATTSRMTASRRLSGATSKSIQGFPFSVNRVSGLPSSSVADKRTGTETTRASFDRYRISRPSGLHRANRAPPADTAFFPPPATGAT